MLEMYTDSARVVEGNVKKALATHRGIFAYAAVSGILGVIILLAFFSLLFPVSVLSLILPVFIGFNAAASAYGIVDKGGTGFPRLNLSLITLSVLYGVTGCLLAIALLPLDAMAVGFHFVVGTLTALFFSFLGATLAKKIRKMNRMSQS